MIGLVGGEKFLIKRLSNFDAIPARDGHLERRTENILGVA